MSLRELLKSERLKIRLAATEAKAGGMSRLGGLRGGLLGNLLAPVAEPPIQRQPEPPIQTFEPKIPILSLFLQGSRPVRETISSLILSTQQEQPQQEPSNLDPQIIQCPQCGAEALESFGFCPSCATVLRQMGRQESRSLSVSA